MAKALRQYIIRKLREPTEKKTDKDIEWICDSFGFINSRDKDKTAFKILQALINSAKDGKGLTSEEITRRVKPTIGSVIYHLKKLARAGLAVKLGSIYELRMKSLLSTVNEIEREINMVIGDIKKIAGETDSRIGLKNR
jgi:hypothetical protein